MIEREFVRDLVSAIGSVCRFRTESIPIRDIAGKMSLSASYRVVVRLFQAEGVRDASWYVRDMIDALEAEGYACEACLLRTFSDIASEVIQMQMV